MQTNRLSKFTVAQSVIESARRSHKPSRVAVLWSGGKDSTALLYMIHRLYGTIPFIVVYGDLNFGDRELNSYVKKIADSLGFSFIREEILDRVTAVKLRRTGNTDRLSTMMDISYARSMKRLVKEKNIEAFIFGNRWQESKRNDAYVKKDKGIMSYFPFLQMTDMDMWDYVYKNNIPFLKAYRNGIRRTSPIMYIKRPTLANRFVSNVLHTWLRLRTMFT